MSTNKLVFSGLNRDQTTRVEIYIKVINGSPISYLGVGINNQTQNQVASKEEIILEDLLKWATRSGIRFTFDQVNSIKLEYNKLLAVS